MKIEETAAGSKTGMARPLRGFGEEERAWGDWGEAPSAEGLAGMVCTHIYIYIYTYKHRCIYIYICNHYTILYVYVICENLADMICVVISTPTSQVAIQETFHLVYFSLSLLCFSSVPRILTCHLQNSIRNIIIK